MTDEYGSGPPPDDKLDRGDYLTPDQAQQPARSRPTERPARSTVIVCALVGVGLIAWFFFAWLRQGQDVVDAVGESLGTALVLLLIVSIGGAILKNRRP